MRLREVKDKLPDIFTHRGKEYRMSYYSREIFATKKHPTRSDEIIWDEENGSRQIYLKGNDIELL